MGIEKSLKPNQGIIDLRDIEDFPGPYCMSFGFDLGPLIRSIQNVGMINPPLLIEKRGDCHTVIAGYRRIRAFKALHYEEIPCRLLSASQLSPLECLLLNLYDNLATRRFNDVEKGMVLPRLASLLSHKEIIKDYMPLLGLPSHRPTLLFFLRLEDELEEEIKIHLAQGRLSLQAAGMLLDLDREERSPVFQWISKLNLNFNQQKQFIDYITDLGHINKMSISNFLRQHPLEEIYPEKALNNPQRAKAILVSLRAMRFPSLVHSEKAFRKNIARLGLTKGVKIHAPPFFEEPCYRLEVLFKDGRELRGRIERLYKTEGLEGLVDPWEESA